MQQPRDKVGQGSDDGYADPRQRREQQAVLEGDPAAGVLISERKAGADGEGEGRGHEERQDRVGLIRIGSVKQGHDEGGPGKGQQVTQCLRDASQMDDHFFLFQNAGVNSRITVNSSSLPAIISRESSIFAGAE